MWKLWNRLFGWDYVQWKNSADQGVARIYTDHYYRVFYWRYKGTSILDVITTAEQVVWLTCQPSKYIAPKVYES
jgi:hypothetical protein